MFNTWIDEAKWIWIPGWGSEDESGVGKFVYFRKTFELQESGHTCTAHISADSRYRLYVNGRAVTSGPCKGDRFTWYFDTIDITAYLVTGTNVIAVQVLRYPHAGGGNLSVWRTHLPGLFVHAAVRDKEGIQTHSLHSDESWLCLKDEAIVLSQGIYTQFLGIEENVDGSKRPFGWTDAAYDIAGWSRAVSYSFDMNTGNLKPWSLAKRPIPALYETPRRFYQASRVRGGLSNATAWNDLLESDNTIFVPPHTSISVDVDAGELTTGYLELLMSGGKGAVIRLLAAECYEYEPVVIPWIRNKGDRTDGVNGDLYGDPDSYRLAGVGTASKPEAYEPFWFRTFRYVRLEAETADEPLELHRFAYRETGYPLSVEASYRSSDPEEAAMWDISIRTLRRCMHETYEDCPYYEQFQYVMDTRSQILFTYILSGDDRLARRTLHDFYSSILPDGLTQSRYPSVAPQVIPGFSLYWVLMLHDHMRFAGDRELIERYLPGVDAVLGYFHRMRDGRGLVGQMDPGYWSFVDWAESWKTSYGVPEAAKNGPLTVYCFMYAYALQHAAELAEFTGRVGMAEEYKDRANQMVKAVKDHCMSAIRPGIFTDGPGIESFSQHSQVWAVLSGAVSGEEARKTMGTAISDPAFVPCSFAMAFYLFRALSSVDLYNRVDELFAPWRKMARDNLTTWMEDAVSQRSDAHAWGSVPIYEYAAEVLGVQPAAPGFAALRIQPRIGKLSEASGRVMTSRGPVEVEWYVKDDTFNLTVTLPEAIPCSLLLPDGTYQRIEDKGTYHAMCGLRSSSPAVDKI